MLHRFLKRLLPALTALSLILTASLAHAEGCDPVKGTCKFTALPEPKPVKLNEAEIARIDLTTLPLVPKITEHIKAIYQEGLKKGNNIHVFSKVGDCMTATDDFLKPFSEAGYSLGDYGSLAKVIKFFEKDLVGDTKLNSFANPGQAATSGFNAAGVLDSIWSDPKVCKPDESPLRCEYRIAKPGIALIMFGTNDMKSIQPDQFDFYLRRVVVQTANAGIIPVLSTFPVQPGLEKQSVLYNQITARIAADYDLPLINLYLGLKPLPNQGVDPVNTTHMTKPEKGTTGDLTKDSLTAGYNTRNLLTLQTLEAVLDAIDPTLLEQ